MNEQALAVIEEQPLAVAENVAPPAPVGITAAQARVDAVAQLTMKAYDRASMLQLTPDEVVALSEEFPDEAFRSGAAGKEDLIYIEHAHLRGRLNKVFGPGQWAIIPRSRWAEDFQIKDRQGRPIECSRVYVEAMLVIRGCFCAEAVGDMVYYRNNASQNYGDAVEGAKTAALRRCAKELGVGLQAWKKEFCEGWWARKNGKRVDSPRPKPAAPPPPPPPPPPRPEPDPEPSNGDDWKATMAMADDVMGKGSEPAIELVQAEPDAPEGGTLSSGVIEAVSAKEGSKNGKTYTKVGVLIDGTWYNSFDKKHADTARYHKGNRVEFYWKRYGDGRDLMGFKLA